MEIKGRPIAAQLQVVRERIQVIRKILNQSEQLRMNIPSKNNYQNDEGYDDDETIYQAQKNLRDLINTLNSGKEDKYLNSSNSSNYNNDDYSEEYYNNYNSDNIQKDNKEKKRQLATIAVQKTAFHQSTSRSNSHSLRESKHHRFDEPDDSNDSEILNYQKKRIFGLKNKKKKDLNRYKLDYCHDFSDVCNYDYTESSSSCFYCPNCNCKIHKRSKSPKGHKLHKTHQKRNASVSRHQNNFDFLKLSTSSSDSSNSNYPFLDDSFTYDEEPIIYEKKKSEKKHKKSIESGTISSYDTNTSTLLKRYGSSTTYSSKDSDILYSSYDIDDSSLSYYLDDDDDIDVENILHNLEKRRRYISSVNDSYLSSIAGTKKAGNERILKKGGDKFAKGNKAEIQSSSRCLSISSKPRYKYDDSISSSCGILSDLLDDMSDEEEKINRNHKVLQQSRKSKIQSQKQEKKQSSLNDKNNQKQRKRNQNSKSSSSSSSINKVIVFSPKSEEEEIEHIKITQVNNELNQIITKPINNQKPNNGQCNKSKHTVKFILDEEEEDIINNLKSSSCGTPNKNHKNSSILAQLHEEEEKEEEEFKDDIILNSNIEINSKHKLNLEEESFLELSSDNSKEAISPIRKHEEQQNNSNVSFEEEEEPDKEEEEDINKLSLSSSISKGKSESKKSLYTEEESYYENKAHTNIKSSPQNKITSSSLYNDIDLDDLEEETKNEKEIKFNLQTKNRPNSEEESQLIELAQTQVEEEEEDNEVIMINHLNEGEEDFEEENIHEQYKLNDKNSNISEKNNEEENQDEHYKFDDEILNDGEEESEEENNHEHFQIDNKDFNDSDNEEENQDEQFKSNDLNNSENENEEENLDEKSHTLSDFIESGSVNIADDDFL